jgi:DNA-binding response OmpR family regulator/HPt (histidine-containing phosphotransfer) domain-containing protein
MKKILIIEDDQVVAGAYYQKFKTEGYQVQTAHTGEDGLRIMRAFKPDIILLDLMLPHMSGVAVIKKVRATDDFLKTPILVFTNAYETKLVQEALNAGATKCISKVNSSPRELIDLVYQTIGTSAIPMAGTQPGNTEAPPKPASPAAADDSETQANLRKTFVDSLAAIHSSLQTAHQSLAKADNEAARLVEIDKLHHRVHALAGKAGVAGFARIVYMATALEALLKELHEKPKNINASTLRTIAASIDFLGFLFARSAAPGAQEIPPTSILVVDDEPISRRAITYALEIARLQSVTVESPETALKMLGETHFDLVLLDVDMPGMTGFELCTKLRALAAHKKTPVIFVTILNDFNTRTSSTMAGGNDFIAKPFLFIELTVKALIHVLRGTFQAQK